MTSISDNPVLGHVPGRGGNYSTSAEFNFLRTSHLIITNNGDVQGIENYVLPEADASQCTNPPITFQGDTDTGIGSQAAGELDLVVDGNCEVQVTSSNVAMNVGMLLPTSGATASSLDFYAEQLHTTTWSGPMNPTSSNLEMVRIGSQVVLHSRSVINASFTGIGLISMDTVLPASFRPGSDVQIPIVVRSAGTLQGGRLDVSTTGNITIFADFTGSAFTAGNVGFLLWTCAYNAS